VVLAAGSQAEIWWLRSIHGDPAFTVPVSLLMTLSVAVRRRWPLPVVVVVNAASGASGFLLGPQESLTLVAAWLASLYTLAAYARTAQVLTGVVAAAAAVALTTAGPGGNTSHATMWLLGTVLGMVLVHRTVGGRQRRSEALAARARLLEREQQLRAREAVMDERARIARELHDVVAHHVSVMVVQAGAERRVLPEEQESARETLSSIEDVGRQALVEMRRLLGVLRQHDRDDELAPSPDLSTLDLLVEQLREAGLAVELHVEGVRRTLPAGVELTAYRIVQEALTNTLKHAGAARAVVHLTYAPTQLAITISDDGRGATTPPADGAGAPAGGHGLIGMRERVSLHGGTLQTGASGSGFSVRAALPLSEAG
jgi:signal transduction histidine kinase